MGGGSSISLFYSIILFCFANSCISLRIFPTHRYSFFQTLESKQNIHVHIDDMERKYECICSPQSVNEEEDALGASASRLGYQKPDPSPTWQPYHLCFWYPTRRGQQFLRCIPLCGLSEFLCFICETQPDLPQHPN